MISLKMTAAEAKAEGYGSPTEVKPPAYPWGTRITLTDEVAHQLFGGKMPEIGAEVAIDAMAAVVACNMTQQEGGKTRISVELQLTEIDIEQDLEEQPNAADRLYGKGGPKQSEG